MQDFGLSFEMCVHGRPCPEGFIQPTAEGGLRIFVSQPGGDGQDRYVQPGESCLTIRFGTGDVSDQS